MKEKWFENFKIIGIERKLFEGKLFDYQEIIPKRNILATARSFRLKGLKAINYMIIMRIYRREIFW